MGKLDDMRRQRELQHAQGEREARARVTRPAPSAAAPADEVSAEPTDAELIEGAINPSSRAPSSSPGAPGPSPGRTPGSPRRAARDATGVCSGCGKPKPVHNDQIASHQKGLGKICPGSRKPPVA